MWARTVNIVGILILWLHFAKFLFLEYQIKDLVFIYNSFMTSRFHLPNLTQAYNVISKINNSFCGKIEI